MLNYPEAQRLRDQNTISPQYATFGGGPIEPDHQRVAGAQTPLWSNGRQLGFVLLEGVPCANCEAVQPFRHPAIGLASGSATQKGVW